MPTRRHEHVSKANQLTPKYLRVCSRAAAKAWIQDNVSEERRSEFASAIETLKQTASSLKGQSPSKGSKKSSIASQNFSETIRLLKVVGDTYAPLKVSF